LGGIIAPPFMGGVIQATHAYGSAWVALAVILLLASVVIWWGFRRQRAIPIVAPLASVEAGEAI